MRSELRETQAATVVLAALIAYFALFAIGAYTGDQTVQLAADALFGGIAVALGVVLATTAEPTASPPGVAGIALLAGGVGFLAWLVTGVGLLGGLGTLFIVAGIAGYLFAVWRD